jgi:hypothetical protein
MIERLAPLLRIMGISISILVPETGYHDGYFRGCTQCLQTNAEIVP